MIKDFLTKREHIEININDSVYVTNKRIIDYSEDETDAYFKDLSLDFLESISYEYTSKPELKLYGIIGALFFLFIGFKIDEIYMVIISMIWLAIFFILFYKSQVEELIFRGNNTFISCVTDREIIKDVREVYNKNKK